MKFPKNPLAETGTLQLSKVGQWNIILLDATGRVIREERFTGNNWTFKRGDLLPGVYFLQTQGSGVLEVIEILVQ
jgi:hypothetical protein